MVADSPLEPSLVVFLVVWVWVVKPDSVLHGSNDLRCSGQRPCV